MPENFQPATAYGLTTQTPLDGVMVTGEAVRRVSPDSAEFLLEILTSAPSAGQALRDNKTKTMQVVNAVVALGLQAGDVQTVSFHVFNFYGPMMQGLPGYGGMQPQLGPVGFTPPTAGGPIPTGAIPTGAMPPETYNPYEMQFGAYSARNIVRLNVREGGRAGAVADAAIKSGGTLLGGFSLRTGDEAGARRAALEAAGKDARAKAESLATAAGKQLGDPLAIVEEVVASNGTYMAMRAAMPFAFGAGAPQTAGELEYYARVTARFGLA